MIDQQKNIYSFDWDWDNWVIREYLILEQWLYFYVIKDIINDWDYLIINKQWITRGVKYYNSVEELRIDIKKDIINELKEIEEKSKAIQLDLNYNLKQQWKQ